MFERLVESILVEYVSEWVEGLDAEKMKIAVFSGTVEFRDLQLKTSALDQFQLPVKIKIGRIGRLAMKVPWKRLTKEAVKIQIEDLFVLIVPVHQEERERAKSHPGAPVDGDEDSYALRQRWAKQQEVRMRELYEKTKGENADASTAGDDSTTSWGYRERILHNVLDNVSFEFSKIHIRYEDTTQLLSKNPLALGLTIDSIVVSTTNANGHNVFIDRSQSHTPFVHKNLDVLRTGLYCENTLGAEQLEATRRTEHPRLGAYIVRPFNASVKMTINHDDSTAYSIPKLQCVVDISTIQSSVTPDQCNDMISVINFISTHEMYLKRIHCRRQRPRVPIKNNVKEWWRYAIFGVQVMYSIRAAAKRLSSSSGSSDSLSRRCDWKAFATLWLSRKEYIHLHKKMLRAAAKKTAVELVVADRCRTNEIEDKLDVQTIVFFRLCATQELEAEESRVESGKKLSGWKARFNSRSHNAEMNADGVRRRLEISEKTLIYCAVNDQIHASSAALLQRQEEKKSSATILFAVDVAISSVQLLLVEPRPTSAVVGAGRMRVEVPAQTFMQFELDKIVFAMFQRASACNISSSIASAQMLDFSQADYLTKDEVVPRALFTMIDFPTPTVSGNSTSTPSKRHLLSLSIDSSEEKFTLDCKVTPFRYVHHIGVATKLQAYFSSQVEVAAVLKENAEEAFAYSSIWINKAVFDSYSASDGDQGGHGCRKVECSIQLPEIDLLVLSSDVSPVLHAQLIETSFKTKNLLEAFTFSIESIEILFLDGIAEFESGATDQVSLATAVVSAAPKRLQHQDGRKCITSSESDAAAIASRQQHFDFSRRKQSTILRKTRLVFAGEKIVERNRVSRWVLKCTAPPIFFTLSSRQYHQVVQASASWAKSNGVSDLVTAKPSEAQQPIVPKRTNVREEFDPQDERFCLCVLIPRIVIIFEGEDKEEAVLPSDVPVNQDLGEPNAPHGLLGMDLVLDIKEASVEARFSSVAQAIGVEIKSFSLAKREKKARQSASDHAQNTAKREKVPTAEAIEEINKENAATHPQRTDTDEPDPAYNFETKRPALKLLEVGPKISLLISSVDPFKCAITVDRVALYWDQELLITLFRSYLFEEPLLRSAFSSRSSSRASSRSSSRSSSGTNARPESHDGESSPQTTPGLTQHLAPYSIDLRVRELFIFLRPQSMASHCFSIRLSGKDVTGVISTLDSPTFVSITIGLSGGVALDSYRDLTTPSPSRAKDPTDQTHHKTELEVCRLLETSDPLRVHVETAGYGTLTHRTGAGVFVQINASGIGMNFVCSYYALLLEYIQRDILGFFSWFEVMTRPPDVASPNDRTKLDIRAKQVRLVVPRSGFGTNSHMQRPEHMLVEVAELALGSRPCSENPRLEQLGIKISGVKISTCSTAQALAVTPACAARQTTSFMEQDVVFLEITSKPILVDRKKREDRPVDGPNAGTEEGKLRPHRVLELQDIIRKMENMCTHIKVSVDRSAVWVQEDDKAQVRREKPRLALDARGVTLSADPQQLDLIMCLVQENLGKTDAKMDPSRLAVLLSESEKMMTDVDIDLGGVQLNLMMADVGSLPANHDTNNTPRCRAIGRVELRDVKIVVNQYSTLRTQCRVQASGAVCYKVDWISAALSEKPSADMELREVLTTCAELYESTSGENAMRCIDVTVDTHPPPLDKTCSPAPLDVRVHVDTCAVSPPLVHLGMRMKSFMSTESTLPLYTPRPAEATTISISTGATHILVAEYVPERSHHSFSAGNPSDISEDKNAVAMTSLKLIVSGCIVVRVSLAEDSTTHVQVYGRKMSLEVASKWPPEPTAEASTSPTASPVANASPRRASDFSSTEERGGSTLVTLLADYRRVLCDDFAVDMDIFDTSAIDQTTTISASLTHFHAVLCVFDTIMLMDLGSMEWSDDLYEKLLAELTGNSSKRTNSSRRTSPDAKEKHTPSTASQSSTVVTIMLEDASVTFVREIGEYFSPVARMYSYCVMCKVTVDSQQQPALPSTGDSAAASLPATQVVNVMVHFSEDVAGGELRDDDGVSMWGFNTTLGAWEPIMEPWMFTLALKLSCEPTGRTVTKLSVSGSENHALNVNFSPAMLESFCAIVKEFEEALSSGKTIRPSTARVISCGFYLANDCGLEITYWVTNHSDTTSHISRGYTYAPRRKQVPEVLPPRQKVPLKLSTGIFPSLPTDQVVSFTWGDEWHPLTDVRIHNAGKYIYSVLPKKGRCLSTPQGVDTAPLTDGSNAQQQSSQQSSQILLALFDISAVFGYRTLTVSSLVRIFNDTGVAVDCGILGTDGKTIVEIGTIEANEAIGVPMDAIPSLWSVRVFVKPRMLGSHADATKNYRWSNDVFISEKEESTEHFAACSLVLDDYDCRCQRMFDGSQPLHVSQTCRSNGGCFRVWSHVFTSSNASSLKYAQMHVLPPLTFENKCGVPMYIVTFVFKKVRRTGGSEREYFHLVASEKIQAHGSFEFFASSLHESTFCSISLTGFSWSNLFLLPSSFHRPSSARAASASESLEHTRATASGSDSNGGGSSGVSIDGNEIVCSLLDFKSRPATVNVAFQTAYHDRSDIRKVVIQPRFVIRNSTPLALTFAPHVKEVSKMSNAKSFFSLPGSPKKLAKAQCCASPQLEMLHSKLNELNGATTTPSSPVSKMVASSSSHGTPNSSKSRPNDANSSDEDDTECFYCSDVDEIDVQLEGNTLLTSGVQQFRLDGTMGGTNASLRLFDEVAKRWCDLVAIVSPIDACTTRVTFVERYLVVNRSEFELVCAPACDIRTGAQNSRAEEAGTASNRTISAAGGNNAEHFMALSPRSTTAFSWSLRTVIPTDACVRFKLNGVGTSAGGGTVVAATEPGWRWSGKLSLHEVSESALKLSNRYSNKMHVLKVEVRVESAIRVFVVISSEDLAPFPLYRVINSSTHEALYIKQSFDSGTGELSETSATTSALYSRGVPQRVLPGESVCFGWDEAFSLQSLDRVLSISYGTGDDNVRTKVLLDQPGEAQRVELPKSKTRATESHVFVHWYLHGITKTIHVHDTPLPRDKQTGKPRLPTNGGVDNDAAKGTSNALEVHVRLPRLALSILTLAPEELLLLSAEDADVRYAVADGEHDQFEFKLGTLQLDNQLDQAVFPVVFTPLPTASTGSMQLPFGDSAADKVKAKGKALTTSTQDSGSHIPSSHASDGAFVHVSLLRLRYGDGVEYIKYLSFMLRPIKVQVDDVLILEAAMFAVDCFQVVQRYFSPSSTLSANGTTQLPGATVATVGTARNVSTSVESREAFARRRAWSDAAPIASAATPSPTPGLNDDDQWRAVSVGANRTGSGVIVENVDDVVLPPAERRMYIELLELHPLRVQLTFQPNDQTSEGGTNSSDKFKARATYFDSRATALLPLVFVLLQSRIANVDCASLALNALHVAHAFTTHAFLLGAVRQHYTIQGARQLYALVGAADVLGNPLGLVTNLGAGVRDFFYEPMAGLVQSPQEFVFGLSRGTASLVRHSVYGTFNAASKFTGTLSAGVAALSLDRSYMRERDARNRRDVATHFGTGLFYGTKQLGQGIVAGVTGVVTAPARGAMNGGLAGFVEGVGKGLIGVAIKPAAGVLDLAAKTTAGITATATAFDRKPRATRARLPRLLRRTRDTRLRVYCHEEARLAQLLRRLTGYLLPSELYEAHVFLPGGRALLATSLQLLYVIESGGNGTDSSGNGAGPNASMAMVAAGMAALLTDSQRSARVLWAYPLASVWGAQRVARGVSVHIGSSSGLELSGSGIMSICADEGTGDALILTQSSMTAVLVPLTETSGIGGSSTPTSMVRHGHNAGDSTVMFDRVLKFVSDLVARQRERTPHRDSSAPPPRNSIGLVLEPVTADPSGNDKSHGGRVVEVLAGSPCFRAGIEVGDVVVGFAGKKLEPGDHGSSLRLALSLMQRGETLDLMVERRGQVRSVHVAAE